MMEWNLNGIFSSHRFLCGLLGLEKVPQISRMNTDFFDLGGQIYADFSTLLATSWKEIFSTSPSLLQGELHLSHQASLSSGTRGCSWRRYSSARVLVSQRSLCPKGLAEIFLRNKIAIVCRLAEDFMAYDAR